jgi:sRNA-binding protein
MTENTTLITVTEETKPESREQKNYRILSWLYAKFPNIINRKNPKPLMVGVAKVLGEHLPEDIAFDDLKIALRAYYKSQAYMRAMLIEPHRVNLQGEAVSDVTFVEKKSAKDSLERIQIKQLESYLKRYAPVVETTPEENTIPSVVEAEPTATAVVTTEPAIPPEPVKEKTIALESVTPEPIAEPVAEEVKPKKLTLKAKPKPEAEVEPVAQTTPIIQAKTSTVNNGEFAKSRGLKVTLVLDPASIPNIDSTGKKKINLKVQIGDEGLIAKTELSSKSYRKAMNSIEEYGFDACNAILQGSMKKYGTIDEAGLVVQPKKVTVNEPEVGNEA